MPIEGVIRLPTVDEHPIPRRGIAALVNAREMKLVAKATTGAEAIAKFREYRSRLRYGDRVGGSRHYRQRRAPLSRN